MLVVALLAVPSLLLMPRCAPVQVCRGATMPCMMAAAAEEAPPAEAPAEAAVDEAPTGPEEEQRLRAMATSWSGAIASSKASMIAELADLEAKFEKQDPASVKAQLMGSWRLLFTADSDTIATQGLCGLASESHTFIEGHFQTFTKPDPMDIFNGVKDKYHLETFEVISDTFKGSASLAALKGDYYVGPLATIELGTLETYGKREVNGQDTTGAEIRNKWTCAYLSSQMRVCKSEDGSYRVYDKMETADMQAEVSSLRAKEVPVDEAALAAWQEEQLRKAEELKKQQEELDPMDDPNDTRPMWQKRIDKADGIKRTANGTPIINHGPIGGGPTGPPTSK